MNQKRKRLAHRVASLGRTLVARLPLPLRRGLGEIYNVGGAYGAFAYARGMLCDPITSSAAAAAIRTRLANRATVFLDTVERTVFGYASSPYRPLLEAAGYDLGRVRALVAHAGVEETLRRLAHAGVYVAIEEFKGVREARRGHRAFRFSHEDFYNPLAQPGMFASSGGTRSAGIPTSIPVATGRLNAEHTAVTWAAYGLDGLPVVVWYPESAGMATATVLNALARRTVPVRWLKQLPERYPYAHHLATRAGALMCRITLPAQTHVPVGGESAILPWITQGACRNGCVIDTSPSSALRLALAAKQENKDLTRVTFLTTSEPLTATKLAAIRAVGARAFSRFSFSEFGASAAYGCASPARSDDMHVCQDRVAVVQRRRPVDRIGSEVDALLFTSLRSDGRRILLNMETGDYARMTARRCGCPLEGVGWTEHLEEIRSFEKLTPEGGTFLGSTLISLIEEVLPAQFGGDPTDYQLLEHEDHEGFTRLTILVHPRLESIDEEALLQCVERTLERASWTITRVYREAGTLRLRRAAPMMTRAGKVPPLHQLEPDRLCALNPRGQG